MKKVFIIFALLFTAAICSAQQIKVEWKGTEKPQLKTSITIDAYGKMEQKVLPKTIEQVIGNAYATDNKALCNGKEYTIYRTPKTAFIVVPVSNSLFTGYCKKTVGRIEQDQEN